MSHRVVTVASLEDRCSYFLRIPKKVRSLEPSFCGSSGASAASGAVVGGAVDDDIAIALSMSEAS